MRSTFFLAISAAGVAALLCLAACAGPPWTLSKSPNEISLRWYPDDTPSAAADAVAQAHCQSSGKSTALISYDQDGSAQIGNTAAAEAAMIRLPPDLEMTR